MGIFNELNFFVFNMGKGSRIESELFIFKWKTLQQLSKLHLFNFLRHQCSLNDIFEQLIRESDLLYLKETLVLPPPLTIACTEITLEQRLSGWVAIASIFK